MKKNHFHKEGWAPSLILKVRVFGTSKVAYSKARLELLIIDLCSLSRENDAYMH